MQPSRDINFDLSHRVRKLLLAFDLYCFAVFGIEAARAAWIASRARLAGRNRHIECDEFM